MTRVEALKTYFGRELPVTNHELIVLRRADKEGFDELAKACAEALGDKLD